MNRRKFIKMGLVVGSVSVMGAGGYYYYSLFRKPDYGYLTGKEKLVEDLCETVIPQTDTPGASAAGAHHFVIHAVSNILPRKEANTFIDGLRYIEDYCLSNLSKQFGDCKPEQKKSVIHATSSFRVKRNHPLLLKASNKVIGRSFEDLLKDLTAIGFCTSELGATRALAYDFIPVNYDACIALQKDQKSWATK